MTNIHELRLAAELERVCPPGWSSQLDNSVEVDISDSAYWDAMDAYLAGDEQPLRVHYRQLLLPALSDAHRAAAAHILTAVGGTTTDGTELERVVGLVAQRDNFDPLIHGDATLIPEILYLEGGTDLTDPTGPEASMFSRRLEREGFLRDLLTSRGLWHPRMEFHIRQLAEARAEDGDWGCRMGLAIRFAASPSRISVGAELEIWDWLLALTASGGSQIVSEFDGHDFQVDEPLRLVLTSQQRVRVDRDAHEYEPIPEWDFPTAILDDRVEFFYEDSVLIVTQEEQE